VVPTLTQIKGNQKDIESFHSLSNIIILSRSSNSSIFSRRSYTFEAYEELSALRQMGLGNPASILWERLPYSFVIDWFIPIGNYLELIGQVPYLRGRFLRSDTYEEIYKGEWRRTSLLPTWEVTNVPPFNARHLVLQRTTLSALDVPKPDVKVYGAVHGRRLQNALALTHQIFNAAAVFVAGKPRLGKDYRLKFGDDGISQNLLLKLSRF
jgi:hypothetical protein